MNKSEPNILLQADNLTCIREERILFDQLSFAVHEGDIIQVEGANGTGKTSLLRLLAGLSRPYSGQVCYNKITIEQNRDNFNSDLLYIGHLPGVKNELTAEENLAFNLKISGIDSENLLNDLAQVNLIGFEDHAAGHLSAGQHRRIALARLWSSQAKIWILDEPLTAIDKKGVETLEKMFMAHAQRGGCVILTTHQDLQYVPKQKLKNLKLQYNFD